MIICYYKSKETGEYVDTHDGRGKTMEELAPLIENYNRNPKNHRTCGAVEVADDGLEAYLFKTRNERAKIDREAVKEAIDHLYDALAAVRYLEG